MSIALITIDGNIGGQIDTTPAQSGAERVRFSVAVNSRRGEQESTAWYRVTTFGSSARGLIALASQGKLSSGAQVLVAGTLEPREYQHNGQTRTSLDVTASTVKLLRASEVGF